MRYSVAILQKTFELILRTYTPKDLFSRFVSWIDPESETTLDIDNQDADFPEIRVRPSTKSVNLFASSTSSTIEANWVLEISSGKRTYEMLDKIFHHVSVALVAGTQRLLSVYGVKRINLTSTTEDLSSDDPADRTRQWIAVMNITAEIWVKR